MTGQPPTDWDEEAARFDEQPDHGLAGPAVRAAWTALLLPQLPAVPALVADLGCGTGSLSVLLAQAGHTVIGLDRSGPMTRIAQAKAAAAAVPVRFVQGDAADPPCGPASVDVLLARHVLWAMPDPAAAVSRWARLLRRGGRLVLVEGRWSTGAGLTARDCLALVRRHRTLARLTRLDDPALWGGPVADERYLIVSLA